VNQNWIELGDRSMVGHAAPATKPRRGVVQAAKQGYEQGHPNAREVTETATAPKENPAARRS
jgi:hypothetical protein